MRKLKKNEYPKNITSLATNCFSCDYYPKGGSYKNCKNFAWKEANKCKYDIEAINGYITKVYEV